MASRSAAVSLPFSTNFARLVSMARHPRSIIGRATSTSRTSNPACANVCAIPLPIVPAPTTPIVFMVVGASPLYCERHAIAAAEAQRGDAALRVAAFHRVEERGEDAAAARADGVAQRDRAAVDVDLLFADAE